MYGTRLTRDFGESVPEPWKSAINSLNDHQVQRGLRRLTATGSASVPTLPQFVKACRQVGDDEGEARQAPTYLPGPVYDAFHRFGQRALFRFLKTKGAASEECLRKLIAVKNHIVTAAMDDESTKAEELRDVLLAAFEKHWQEMPAEEAQRHERSFQRTGFVSGH